MKPIQPDKNDQVFGLPGTNLRLNPSDKLLTKKA